jgi:hypothetical protein
MRIVGMCPRKRKVSVCVLDSHPDGLRFVKAGYHDVTREAIAAALSVFSGKESRRLIAVEVSPKYPVAAGICIGLSWPNQVGLMVSSELTRSMAMLLDVENWKHFAAYFVLIPVANICFAIALWLGIHELTKGR